MQNEEYEQAHSHIQRVVQLSPWTPADRLLASRIARLGEDLKEAEKQLDECVRLQGGPSEDSQLERLLLRAERGELDDVAPGLEYALAHNDPHQALILEGLSWASARLLQHDRTLNYIDQWLLIEPDNVRALALRSWVLDQLRRHEEAIQTAEYALTLAPGRTKLRLALVNLYMDRKNSAAALPHAKIAADQQPNNPEALAALGQCLVLQGRADEGQPLLEKAILIDPDNPTALGELSKLRNREGRPAEAEQYALRALDKSPNDPDVLFSLVESLRLQDRQDAATEAWQQRYDRVRADLTTVDNFLRHGPGTRGTSVAEEVEAGAAMMRLDNDSVAVRWLIDVVNKNPNNRQANLLLADYYEKKGVADLAEKLRRKAEASRPTLGPAAAGALGCPAAAGAW